MNKLLAAAVAALVSLAALAQSTNAVGDKVRFAAEKVGGDYTVTAIVKVP